MRSRVLDGTQYRGLAFCTGSLKDIGSYPGLVAGQGRVLGEVYTVSDEALVSRLDEIEGYVVQNERGSLYVRRTVSVRFLSTGQRGEAGTYLYNCDCAACPAVSSGDYRRHLLDCSTGPVYYIAYGSNLDPARMKKRIGQWNECRAGYLRDFRLTCNKRPSGTGNGAYANITPGVPGRDCPAVAYLVERDCIRELDSCEGVPRHYIRTVLPLQTADGAELMGYVYIAHPDRLVSGRRASDGYRRHLLNGYVAHGLGDLELYES